jgi:hypothetical protein
MVVLAANIADLLSICLTDGKLHKTILNLHGCTKMHYLKVQILQSRRLHAYTYH